MNTGIIPMAPNQLSKPDPVLLKAEPQSLEIDLKRTAIVVVDMQNAYVSKGGMFDLMGWADVSGSWGIIEPIKEVSGAARSKGVKVIYIVTKYSPDLSESGNANSPSWYRGRSLVYREHPEWSDKLLTEGTWGQKVIDALTPEKNDLQVEKYKYSGFFNTSFDIVLRTLDIKYLIFTGVATNICIEATLRDAFYLDYFCILAADATVSIGLPIAKEASINNVKSYYGWVASYSDVVKILQR